MNRSVHMQSRRRGGYTIIELLVVISGTVALLAAGTTTIVTVRRVAERGTAAAEAAAGLSRLHRTLRADAAAATAATADDGGLTLSVGDGSVRYEADGADVLRVVDGPAAGRDRFTVGGAGFTFTTAAGPAGVRAAVGFDRAGRPAGGDGSEDDSEGGGPAVELAAWLPAGGEGGE